MGEGIDIYDVTAQAEKVVREERYARIRHVESVEKDLRAEFRREVMELREEVGELVAEVHKLIEAEKEARDASDRSLLRIINQGLESVV
jgi:predicted phage gp36 major capsid-like protein